MYSNLKQYSQCTRFRFLAFIVRFVLSMDMIINTRDLSHSDCRRGYINLLGLQRCLGKRRGNQQRKRGERTITDIQPKTVSDTVAVSTIENNTTKAKNGKNDFSVKLSTSDAWKLISSKLLRYLMLSSFKQEVVALYLVASDWRHLFASQKRKGEVPSDSFLQAALNDL